MLEQQQIKSSRRTDLQVIAYHHRSSGLFHLSPFFVRIGFGTSKACCFPTLVSPKMECRSIFMHKIGTEIFQLMCETNSLAIQELQRIILDFICRQSDQMSLLVAPDFNSLHCSVVNHMIKSSVIYCYISIRHNFSDLQTSLLMFSNFDCRSAAHACSNLNSCSQAFLNLFKF